MRCANDEDCPSSFRVTDSEVDSKAEFTEGSSFKLTVSIGCVSSQELKKTPFASTETVINMMKEAELQEEKAELSKREASLGGLDTLERVEDLRQMLQRAREINDMHIWQGRMSCASAQVFKTQFSTIYGRRRSTCILAQLQLWQGRGAILPSLCNRHAGYGTSAGGLTKYNAGISPTNPYYKALIAHCMTLSLDFIFRFDKGYTPIASYVHHLDALRTTNENTITVGGLYTVDPLTYVKYRLNNEGKLDGLMQHELKLKSILTPRPWIRLPGSSCPLLSSLE
ncbi:hypothetical protein MKW98_031487 [Papaver atlanticum]|uniref:Uncharacterized protein n=1 Tax=Papaver atlanticum TaxID=357466 RepID=A0AAD4S603_9MAGN|nr:hypothetical protein MKW98_031487 [Papaver atlanticum]